MENKKSEQSDVKTSVHATRYLFVGIGITLFNYIFYTILANLVIKNNDILWLSSLIATVAAVIVAYISHSKITWKERNVTRASIIRFFIWNALLAVAISPILTQLFSLITPIYEFAFNITSAIHFPFTYEFVLTTGAFVLTSIITMILNFLFYDKFVFQKHTQDKPCFYGDQKIQKECKISVIVPVYNTAKYLPRCLDSILNQTYKNLEIIVVNDGSTDNSDKIIKKYSEKDHRIKIATQKNQGLSAARNAGIEKSTGDYITFVDSDDEIESEMIHDMLSAIQSTDTNIAVCSFQETYPSGKTTHFNQNYPAKIYTTEEALKAMLKEQGFMVSATMKLFPKKYFRHIKFPIGKLHEDVGTTYKLIMQARRVVYLPNEFYIYCHHEDSIVFKEFDDRKFDIIALTDEMCSDIDKKFPELKNTTKERRMRARFSILRQISTNHPEAKNILSYLKKHKTYITKNPEATTTDKIALKLALFSPKLFKFVYRLFK